MYSVWSYYSVCGRDSSLRAVINLQLGPSPDTVRLLTQRTRGKRKTAGMILWDKKVNCADKLLWKKKKNLTEGNYSVWETWASAPNFDHLSKHQQGDLKRNEEILELWWCYNTEEDIVVCAPTSKQQLCKKNKKKMVWGWDAERYRCLNLNTFPDLNSVMRKIFKYSNQYLIVQWEYIKKYVVPLSTYTTLWGLQEATKPYSNIKRWLSWEP